MSVRAVASIVLLAAALAAPVAAQVRAAEEGPRWQELSAPQRSALKPLEREWPGIAGSQKQKWLEIAARYPKLPAAEQARMSARMTQWAALSPNERGKARQNFQEARQLTPQERQARWEAYQALTPEQRRKLATDKASAARDGAGNREPGQAKSNIVPNPALAAPPRTVAPTVVQAASGATTSLIGKRPAPPSHQQPGLPKITASPGFVDHSTLLPQRGPQGAAARAAEPPASAPRRNTK